MSERTEPLDLIRSLARKIGRRPAPQRAVGQRALAREIERAFSFSERSVIPTLLWELLDELLAHEPASGLALAQTLDVLSRRGGERLQIWSALGLLTAFNICGKYRAVRERMVELEPRLRVVDARDAAVRVWLEAAWAESYLGDLPATEQGLAMARRAMEGAPPAPEIELRMRWIRARILRERGEYKTAVAQFEGLHGDFERAGLFMDAARVLRETGHTFARLDPSKGLLLLARARHAFVRNNIPKEIALCDYFTGQCYFLLTRDRRAVQVLGRAWRLFAREGLDTFAAWCDLDMGLAFWRLGELGDAARLLERARQFFLAAGSASEASSCEINLALVQLDLYHFDAALSMLNRALEQALAEGRHKKAAVCYESIAWAYDKQGEYGPALENYLRARAEFETENLVERLVGLDLYLVGIYINLGQYENAFAVLTRAQQVATAKKMRGALAEIQLVRGRCLLALGRKRPATVALKQARRRYQRLGHVVNVALCDRMLAQTNPNDKRVSARRLTSAQRILAANHLPVEAALTELARADLALEWGEWTRAREAYERVHKMLAPGFPDAAWRAAYGAGRASLALGEPRRALDEFLTAVHLVARVRASVTVEAESNSFLAARRRVFETALECALACREAETALRVVELSKAQTFLQSLGREGAPFKPSRRRAQEIQLLEKQERVLRAQVLGLRTELVLPPTGAGERTAAKPARVAGILRRLNQATRAYERVSVRLQLARSPSGTRPRTEFSARAFRRLAGARWGKRWAALDFMFVAPKRLVVVYVDARQLIARAITLDEQAYAALTRCTDTHPDQRERIYRGTLNGFAVPEAYDWLGALTAALLPPEVQTALQGCASDTTLVISPQGILHQLPFHALALDGGYLVEKFEPVYLPNLSTLTTATARCGGRALRLLACGLSEFGRRAAPLPGTRLEFAAVKRQNRGHVTALWGERATRAQLLEWNERGGLKRFGALHLATHAIVDEQTPQLSRVLLADGDLTVMDVFGLKLNAEFVFLSGCSSGLGEGGAGDEIVGLAHAFFRAGARALVGSLWAVRDDSTAHLMTRVYAHRTRTSPGSALRRAQLEMLRAGYPVYDWAGFVWMASA